MNAERAQAPQLTDASPSVHTHLNILQGVVQRMAGNSAACKTWCITIVSAVLVVVADKQAAKLFWLAALPIPVFAALDIYYLGLEKGFRESYTTFVRRLHSGTATAEDLYVIAPPKDHTWLRAEALASFSVWGFYVPLGFVVVLARFAVL